jgi:hypothetical protein
MEMRNFSYGESRFLSKRHESKRETLWEEEKDQKEKGGGSGVSNEGLDMIKVRCMHYETGTMKQLHTIAHTCDPSCWGDRFQED